MNARGAGQLLRGKQIPTTGESTYALNPCGSHSRL